nr:toprim domain-containing protein [Niveispirillum sp. SYP-B3756]
MIEAPGKVRRFAHLAREIGIRNAEIVATKGHLLGLPSSLWPVAIGSDLLDHAARQPRDLERINLIRSAARRHDIVYVATDPDQEGDVIAADIAAILEGHTDLRRLRLPALTANGLTVALAAAGPVNIASAVPGRARAVVDRIIGSVFSRPGRPAGRVWTALLGSWDQDLVPSAMTRVKALAADAGRHWIATLPGLHPDLPPEILTRLARATAFPARVAPASTGELLIDAAAALDRPVKDIMDDMQEAYEAGLLSYPRASGRLIGTAGRQQIAAIANRYALRYDPHRGESDEGAAGAHEAPHPVTDVPIASDLSSLPAMAATAAFVARRQMEAGQDLVDETPDLGALPPDLASLGWSRRTGWRRPRTGEQEAQLGAHLVRPDVRAVMLLLETGIGRPSTFATFADQVQIRGVIGANGRINERGLHMIESTPLTLRSPSWARFVEDSLASWVVPSALTLDQLPVKAANLTACVLNALPGDANDKIRSALAGTDGQRLQTSETAGNFLKFLQRGTARDEEDPAGPKLR